MKLRIGKTMNTHKYKIGDLVKIGEGAFGWDGSPDGDVVKINYIWKGIHECCYKGDYFSFSYDDIDHEATEKLVNLKEAGDLHKEITSNDFISNVAHPSHYNHKVECVNGGINSDGGPSAYYDFHEGWSTWNDFADYKATQQWKEHSFHLGNVGKVLCRWGDKSGTSKSYDARKVVYSGLRVLLMLEGKENVRAYLENLLEDNQFKG